MCIKQLYLQDRYRIYRQNIHCRPDKYERSTRWLAVYLSLSWNTRTACIASHKELDIIIMNELMLRTEAYTLANGNITNPTT